MDVSIRAVGPVGVTGAGTCEAASGPSGSSGGAVSWVAGGGVLGAGEAAGGGVGAGA